MTVTPAPTVLNARVVGKKFAPTSDTVYIGRPSKWGNPFVIGKNGSRRDVIDAYRRHLEASPALLAAAKNELAGKNLVCWCAPQACHGDVLLAAANGHGGPDTAASSEAGPNTTATTNQGEPRW